MTVVEVLRKARALIRKGWTQDEYGRDKDGNPSGIEEAASVCMEGACIKAAGASDWCQAVEALAQNIPGKPRGVLCFNDKKGRTKQQVVAVFDRAIKAETARGRQEAKGRR